MSSGGQTRYYQTHGDQKRQNVIQGSDADISKGVDARVKSGWNNKHQKLCTEILIFVKGVTGHYHFVVDDQGNEMIDV